MTVHVELNGVLDAQLEAIQGPPELAAVIRGRKRRNRGRGGHSTVLAFPVLEESLSALDAFQDVLAKWFAVATKQAASAPMKRGRTPERVAVLAASQAQAACQDARDSLAQTLAVLGDPDVVAFRKILGELGELRARRRGQRRAAARQTGREIAALTRLRDTAIRHLGGRLTTAQLGAITAMSLSQLRRIKLTDEPDPVQSD